MPLAEMPSRRDPLENEQSVYSIGTAYAVDGLEVYLRSMGNRKANVIAINVGTLLRNGLNHDPNMTMQTMARNARTELHVMVEDIANMMLYARIQNPAILLYLIDYYQFIPEEVVRPIETSKARAKMQSATKYALTHHRELFGLINSVPGVNIQFDLFQRATAPHKHILTLLRALSPQRTVMMLSHVALDYHVYSKLNSFHVIESHTAQIRGIEDMGMKVFKKEHLPFNKYTHALLGDKDYLKSPLSNKQRKEMYDLAEKRNWESRTLTDIKSDINKLGLPILIALD